MIQCKLCGDWFLQITWNHLKYYHGITLEEYQRQFPVSPTYSEETLGHISEAASQTHSESTIENQRKAQLARWGGTTREFRMEHYKNSFGSEKAKNNLAVSKQAYWDGLTLEEKEERLNRTIHSSEARREAAETHRAIWASLPPEEKKARLDATINSDEAVRASAEACARKPNKTELLLWEFLDEAFPGLFIYNGDRKVRIGRRFPDFISRNGFKLVLEAFGPYWHGPLMKDGEDEEKVKADYRELGYECIVVWISNEDDVIVEWPNIKKVVTGLTSVGA